VTRYPGGKFLVATVLFPILLSDDYLKEDTTVDAYLDKKDLTKIKVRTTSHGIADTNRRVLPTLTA
jgi:hypothetical protein